MAMLVLGRVTGLVAMFRGSSDESCDTGKGRWKLP